MKLLICAQIVFGKIHTQTIVTAVASGKENCVAEGALSLFALVPLNFVSCAYFPGF